MNYSLKINSSHGVPAEKVLYYSVKCMQSCTIIPSISDSFYVANAL